MKRLFLALPIVALAAAGTTGCATKKFVTTRVGEVNDKVQTLSKGLEDTQERTRKNEEHLTQHDSQLTQVDQKAETAGRSASEARSAADTANARAEAVDRASKRIVYEVTLSEDQGNFKFGQAALPDEARARLDELVTQLKANPNGAFIEVEGYTDATGSKEINERLGLERAEAVKRYLYEQHQVPLHKINVISYGEENPIAPNNTREGRAKNRRVVVKVLS
jgi:outer membrane protein OmpA-like peptidoglycan-associated protein